MMGRDLLLLLLRSAISEKEWCIACANRELALGGAWSRDWNVDFREADSQVAKFVRQIEDEADDNG